ncbi:MAG: hypothetical protein V1742_06790, partial [Pseudomonadota bacterium]
MPGYSRGVNIRSLVPKVRLALLILALGILFSLYLQTFIQDEVFYAGDLGLKMLQVKGFLDGPRLDLVLPAPAWVKQLWNQGLYPFKPPFVYHLEGRYYVHYPFLFPLISAPFYHWFGYRGLYLIPLLSVWVLWMGALLTCRRLGLDAIAQAVVLISLIFASPLTVYSATFWEYAPAVTLAGGGLFLLLPGFQSGLSRTRAAAAGALIGLSVWFRPELLCLAGLLVLLLPGRLWTGTKFNRRFLVVLAMIIPVALFFGLNVYIYGHPFGLHGRQVMEGLDTWERARTGFSISDRAINGLLMTADMGRRLVFYFPLCLAVPLIYLLTRNRASDTQAPLTRLLGLLSVGLFFSIPFIVPLGAWDNKQWGPRFLLPLIPLLALLAGLGLGPLRRQSRFRLYFGLAGLAAALVMGTVVNTYVAAQKLHADYSGR